MNGAWRLDAGEVSESCGADDTDPEAADFPNATFTYD